jgi:hypothetical protein
MNGHLRIVYTTLPHRATDERPSAGVLSAVSGLAEMPARRPIG